jgi:hypothetical protein
MALVDINTAIYDEKIISRGKSKPKDPALLAETLLAQIKNSVPGASDGRVCKKKSIKVNAGHSSRGGL